MGKGKIKASTRTVPKASTIPKKVRATPAKKSVNVSFANASRIVERKLKEKHGDTFKISVLKGWSSSMNFIQSTVKQHFGVKSQLKINSALVLSIIPDKDMTLFSENPYIFDDIRKKLNNIIYYNLHKERRQVDYYQLTPYTDSFCMKSEVTQDHLTLSLIGSMAEEEYMRNSGDYSIISKVIEKWDPDLQRKVNDFIEKVEDFRPNLIPLSVLLIGKPNRNIMNIEYGYTYMRARKYGFTTVMRKLFQLYAYENNVDLVSTLAIAWGSQIASVRAGFVQMPLVRNKMINWNMVPNDLKEQLKFNENTQQTEGQKKLYKLRNLVSKATQSTTKSKPYISRHAQYLKQQKRKQPTNKNLNVMKQYYGGKVPLNIYGNNDKINTQDFTYKDGTKVTGSHMRRLTKNKMETIYRSLM